MAAATPFSGMDTENTYRHIRHFMTLWNTVHQEVHDECFKSNLFPYSLAGEAKTWYLFALFQVEGNWNKLTKKFCEKFFCNYQCSTSKEASDHLHSRRRGRDRPSLEYI
jgi:hypothetical protein